MGNIMEAKPFGKQLTAFKALGPYIRVPLTTPERVFFDCLSTCVDIEKSAELREFWGWWLELVPCDGGYHYNYWYGLFNESGTWEDKEIPKAHKKEVNKTLERFFIRLHKLVEKDFSLSLTPSKDLENPKISEAA